MPAVLRDRPAVPLAKVGKWAASTGEWECTADQLRDAVLASKDPTFRTPVIKLGHTDRRFTGDGQPAVGRVINLRLTDDGQTLLGDLVGIPAWLDDVLESAYPSRSIEADLMVQTAAGARYGMVLTGLALLGAAPPAIESLGDIAALYGQDTSVHAYLAASRLAAAALPPEEPMPERRLGQVVASASIDELVSAFEDWAGDQPLLGQDCWVRDIGTDYLVATVWLAGGENKLYRVDWSETDQVFQFGDPVLVRLTYEPVQAGTQNNVSASGVRWLVHDVIARRSRREASGALLSARGRAVIAGGQSNEESRVPITPALAEALGVDPNADDEAVETAARTLREKADAQPPAAPTTQESGQASTPAPADIERIVEAKVAASVAAAVEPYRTQLAATSQELASIKQASAAEAKKALFDAAVQAGKIAPAERATWEARYDQAPAVITDVLGTLAAGAAIPTAPLGHAGGEVDSLSAEEAALWASLYGNAPAGSDA